jgi:arginase family enzyme
MKYKLVVLLSQGNFVCEELYATGRLTSMEVVEVNANLAHEAHQAAQTVDMANTLIRAALGRTILL